jgi:two-component system chemotaxis response regulator CheY
MSRILIVDDSPTIRKMVRASLRPLASFDFVEAANGIDAIEQVAIGPVALLILDLNMPDMHGVDVLKFLRRHPSSREVPVVVLTTRGDDASREAAMAAGATQYLTKPFVPQNLLATVREL